MYDTLSLPAIARQRDAKIDALLAGASPICFWYAMCPPEGMVEEHGRRLHALGFDNYPLARIPAIDALQPHLFFFERILGAEMEQVGDNGDFFHTWCRPLIHCPDDISRLTTSPDASPLWQAYEAAIAAYLEATLPEERLPVGFPGLSPLDIAAALCGAESLFLLLYEEPEAAERLLDTITTLIIAAFRRVRALGADPRNPYGFPGVYCNDLHLPSLSPAHVARLMLPCYTRLAVECGGLILSLLSADIDILRQALRMDGLIGCTFDKRLPLEAIAEVLGNKLFVVQHYVFHDEFDTPTFHNGSWCNPIVQCYSRELPDIYRAFAERHNLLITLDRPSLAEVCATRQALIAP